MNNECKALLFTKNEKKIIDVLHKMKHKFLIQEVSDFKTFKEAIMKEKWDIILFDYCSKDNQSYEVMSAVKKAGLHSVMIAIIHTIDVHQAFLLAKEGCDYYVMKEDYEALYTIINKSLYQAKDKGIHHTICKSLCVAMASIESGVISIDGDNNIIFMNKAAEAMIEWQRKEVIQKPARSFVKIIDSKTREVLDFKNIYSQSYSKEKYLLVTKSGREKGVYMKVSKIEKGSGAIIILRDATEYMEIEEKLKVERNNLRTLFQYAPVGMVIVDENAIIQKVNDCYLDKFGRSCKNPIGVKLGESIGCIGAKDSCCSEGVECNHCLLKECVRQVVKSRIPFRDMEKCCQLFKEGKVVYQYLKFNLVPVTYSGKTHVLISVDDMTKYKVMEENLRKSRDFYLALFDEFPAMIWRSNTEKRIDYLSKRWMEFRKNISKEEMIKGWMEFIHPDDVKMCIEAYNLAYINQEPYELQYRVMGSEGEYRWIVNHAGPYYTLDGEFAGFIGACYDITEEKKARDVLRRYELLSEKAKDIILVFDTDGRIIEANEAAIHTYGYTREELLDKTIFDLRGDKNTTRKQFETAIDSSIFFEAIHNRKDGSCLPVEVSAQSTTLGENKVVVSIIRDITDRKQVEQQMQQAVEASKAAYKAKSEFLANMSHEIRTPLNGIIGMLDLTLLTDLTADQMDNLSIAKTCANSLLKVINDVLDFSKMEAGKLSIEQIEFDFKGLIEKIVKVHYYQAKEKGIDLTYQIPIELPSVFIGDPNRLQQILNNLLSNAIKFTDKGYVSLLIKTVQYIENSVLLKFSIVDTGIGISNNEMDKLFKSFSQIDGSQTRRFGGTGLGLVISRQLIERMGGILKVESEKDRGSVFSFTLQFKIDEVLIETEDQIKQKLLEKTKKNAKILLVEDDKVNQTVIGRMLREMGYQFHIADCGNDALRLLEYNRYDLCLMDIQMAGLDGIQTASIIRKRLEGREKYMPIVAITAHALSGDRERFLAMGMDEYIAKPFQISELFILLERLLDKHQMDGQYKKTSISKSVGTVEFDSYLKNYAEKIKPVVEDMEYCIQQLKGIIKSGNMEITEEVAHSFKNLASSISADKLKTLAFRIELAARRDNSKDAVELIEELEKAFDKYAISINEMEDLG